MEVPRPAGIGDASEAGKHVGEEAVQLRMVGAEVVHFPPCAQDFRLAMPFFCLPIARFLPCARVFRGEAGAVFLQRLQLREDERMSCQRTTTRARPWRGQRMPSQAASASYST